MHQLINKHNQTTLTQQTPTNVFGFPLNVVVA